MNATTAASRAAPDVDLRGFGYALEPVLRKEQWRADRLLAELAKAEKALRDTEAEREAVGRQRDAEVRIARLALMQRLDPVIHRKALAYLAGLRERCRRLDEQCRAQRAARDQARQACVAQQLRLEGFAQHKTMSLTAYADEVRQRVAAEQDRDWLARSVASRSTREVAR